MWKFCKLSQDSGFIPAVSYWLTIHYPFSLTCRLKIWLCSSTSISKDIFTWQFSLFLLKVVFYFSFAEKFTRALAAIWRKVETCDPMTGNQYHPVNYDTSFLSWAIFFCKLAVISSLEHASLWPCPLNNNLLSFH